MLASFQKVMAASEQDFRATKRSASKTSTKGFTQIVISPCFAKAKMQAAKGDLLLALTTELCTQMLLATASFHHRSTAINQAFISFPWLRRESSRERDLRVIRKVNRVFETAQMNIYIAASLHAGLGTKIMFTVRPLPHSDFTLLIPLYDYHPTPALLAFVPPPWPQVEL